MASSMTMTASFLGGAAAAKRATATNRRGPLAIKASMESEKAVVAESSNTRRGLVLAVVAAAASSITTIAMAEEPKRGSAEAKKKYAPICVTMPTARICRN